MDTTEETRDLKFVDADPVETRPALVLVWCAEDPTRVGEVALPAALEAADGWVIGRGERAPPRGKRLTLVRQRPGVNLPRPPLEAASVSREQLGLLWDGRLVGERLGSAAMELNGRPYDGGPLENGDLLSVGRSWLWLVEPRPAVMPALRVEVPPFAFGEPDAWGLVGESMAMWSLRERIATVGPLAMHVLLSGPSGAGKELVARALHAASPRQKRPLVSRNAATLPPGLVDAELFGNVRGYPNPTMAERPGLIGAADGGTLFLDELGELSHEVQAHLLRVLDEGGEYQRLGESHTRHSDLRLVGATNRSTSALKHDLLQRFRLRIEVVGLDERRSDIPLLLVHLIGVLRQRSATLHERGLVRRGGRTVLDLDLGFLSRLISRPTWVGHVRELDAEVWQAFLNVTGVTGSSGGLVGYRPDDTRTGATPMDPTRSTDPQLPAPAPEVLVEKAVAVEQAVARADDATAEGRAAPNDDPGKEAIARALDDAGGNISGAARGLGLTSRFALYRLMQRHGIVFRRRDAE